MDSSHVELRQADEVKKGTVDVDMECRLMQVEGDLEMLHRKQVTRLEPCSMHRGETQRNCDTPRAPAVFDPGGSGG